MTYQTEYVPPKVWSWDKESGGRFTNINRPIAGPTHDKRVFRKQVTRKMSG